MSNKVIQSVRIRVYDNRVVGIVTTTRGYCFACTYAQDWPLTEEILEREFKKDRKAFRPYDEVEGRYL
jgi:hypothetical protein